MKQRMLYLLLATLLLSACGKHRDFDKVDDASVISGICFELEEGTHIINSDQELETVLNGQDCPQLFIDFNTRSEPDCTGRCR